MNYIRGTAAANTLRGTAGADTIDGLAGNDLIDGRGGNDILIGGPGADIFIFRPGDGLDRIVDAEAADRIWVVGEPVHDIEAFRSGNDLAIVLHPDPDYDWTNLSNRIVVVDFFAGRRIGRLEGDFALQNIGFDYSNDPSFAEVFFAGGAAPGLQTGTDQGQALEFIFGTDEDDELRGNGGLYDVFRAGDGNDVIFATAQINFFRDEAGDDTYNGSTGIDRIRAGRGGNDVYDGGAGNFDRIDYRDSLEGIRVDLARTGPQLISASMGRDTLLNIEEVRGSFFNDRIFGDANVNRLYGQQGNDVLNGRGGADIMEGGQGDDIYYVDDAGDQVIEYFGAFSGLDLVYATISYTLPTAVENLRLLGTANLNGTGNTLNNAIYGNSGANILDGGDGRDLLVGKAGNDTLLGGAGNDRLIGGAGADTLTGGPGNDRFEYKDRTDSGTTAATRDTITDFTIGQDRIVMREIDGSDAGGFQRLSFIGTAAFTAAAQVRAVQSGSHTILQVNLNADTTTVEMAILLQNVTATALSAGDFLF